MYQADQQLSTAADETHRVQSSSPAQETPERVPTPEEAALAAHLAAEKHAHGMLAVSVIEAVRRASIDTQNDLRSLLNNEEKFKEESVATRGEVAALSKAFQNWAENRALEWVRMGFAAVFGMGVGMLF